MLKPARLTSADPSVFWVGAAHDSVTEVVLVEELPLELELLPPLEPLPLLDLPPLLEELPLLEVTPLEEPPFEATAPLELPPMELVPLLLDRPPPPELVPPPDVAPPLDTVPPLELPVPLDVPAPEVLAPLGVAPLELLLELLPDPPELEPLPPDFTTRMPNGGNLPLEFEPFRVRPLTEITMLE